MNLVDRVDGQNGWIKVVDKVNEVYRKADKEGEFLDVSMSLRTNKKLVKEISQKKLVKKIIRRPNDLYLSI